MRGKESSDGFFLMNSGITPAYAGKRVASTFSLLIVKGSPPPMRGKGVAADTMIDVTRITPAYAGKSSAMSRIKSLYWDHPRLCGEKNSTTGNER